MKGSDLLVAALENEGVERIFGVPGEENLDVVESLRRPSIKLIVTRHEAGRLFHGGHARMQRLVRGRWNLTTGMARCGNLYQ
jgi:acetolactate synthase I/II/III large subunit